ncbi:MAG TPA: toll/interleukin-1 receptor domain-containing protein, partial [Ktedonobacteraceae bacterium]
MKEPFANPLKIFSYYAPADKRYHQALERHLKSLDLYRSGQITGWDSQQILAGTQWEREIDQQLTTSDIILLLISADFLSSNVCSRIEMKALELHDAGRACVIPIIVRPVEWTGTPLARLPALPPDGRPIAGRNRDGALQLTVSGIRSIIATLIASQHQAREARQNTLGKGASISLVAARDLKPDSFKLGDAAAATFPYILLPVQEIYNQAIQVLLQATTQAGRKKRGILLAGESNAGKTRFALEALKKALPDWPVLRWRPTDTVDTVSSNDDTYAYESSVQTASRLGRTAAPAPPRPNCNRSELLFRNMFPL